MNIFYFTHNIVLNSKLLDDKRLVKMILETTQLLSNALYCNGEKSPYKPTHLKHPCTIWASKSSGNWNWLRDYGLALAKEYTNRYNKIHKCEDIIRSMKYSQISDNKFYEPTQCMPNQYKCTKSTKAYIKYYIGEKFNPAYFKHCDKRVFDFWNRLYRQTKFNIYSKHKNKYFAIIKKIEISDKLF